MYSDNYCDYCNYTTLAGCEQIARQMAGGYSLIAVSPNGDETWAIEGTWLLHQREGEVERVEIPHQDVLALAADPVHGGVWMATEDGLVHGELRTPIEDQALSTHYVFQPFSLNSEIFPGSALAFTVDEAGQVWAVNGDSVLRYDESDQTWRQVISTRDADAIAADPVRGVWIAGNGELSYFDGAQWRTWPISGTYYSKPTALLVGENGRVWMGTLQRGVWTTVPPMQSAGATDDEQPVLDWRQFAIEDGLADELITALARGPDGRIYAAHYAGISVFDPAAGVENGRWTTLPGSDADRDGWINALAFAPPLRPRSGQAQAEGGLWVGYHRSTSLRRYQDGRWANHHLPPWCCQVNLTSPRAEQGIGALLVDEDGALWVGTTEGLWRWPAAGEGTPCWQIFDVNVLTMRNVLALAQDDQGRIWVGGTEGVAMWEGDR